MPMSETNDNPRSGFLNLSCALAVVLLSALLIFVWFRISYGNSLDRADRMKLRHHLKQWVEAGSPQGTELAEFMRKTTSDIVVTNRVFAMIETNYIAQFALVKPNRWRAGTLFVTTNEVLIWVGQSGRIKTFANEPLSIR